LGTTCRRQVARMKSLWGQAWMGLGLALIAASPSHGATQEAQASSEHTTVSLVAELEWVQPGEPFWVGLRLEMDEHWHTYWRNPGDAGLATRIRWTLPEGLEAGPLVWPRPERMPAGPLMSYGYEGETLLLTEITPTVPISGDSVRLQARVDWLECKEACLPGRAELHLDLPVRAATPRPAAAAEPLFREARRRLPVPAEGWQQAMSTTADGSIVLDLLPPEGTPPLPDGVYFFPMEAEVVEHAAPQRLLRAGGGYRLEVPAAANAVVPDTLRGVLVAGHDDDAVALRIDAAPAATATAAAATPPPPDSTLSLPLALAFSFLGGLILNLMPCVLPVLSLKVMALVKHGGESPARRLQHGLAYTAGVLSFFWILAGLLLALRAGGEQIGWGFQLQSPAFVAFLAALFCLISLNLFGVFEVGASLTRAGGIEAGSGLASSFWTGALATIAATPCTAPFMGSALGYALGQPPATSLLVFTLLGLGMAFPYLLLSRFEGLLRFVPRPGPWMASFKQLMGFVMMAAVVALVWLFGRQAGVNGMSLLLASLLVIGLATWLYGRGEAPGKTPRTRLASGVAAALLLLVGLGLSQAAAAAPPAGGVAEPSAEEGPWEPFSPGRLAELRAEGRPVFIDFTADWCLTCQVNHHVAFGSGRVFERMEQEGIVALRADWTQRDDRITAALASYGRQGVPLYVLHGPGPDSRPRLLPEVISEQVVLDAIDELAPPAGSS